MLGDSEYLALGSVFMAGQKQVVLGCRVGGLEEAGLAKRNG